MFFKYFIISNFYIIMTNSYSIYIFPRTQKTSKKTGETPLYARVKTSADFTDISTGIKVKLEQIDPETKRVVNHPLAEELNNRIESIRLDLLKICYRFELTGEKFTAEQVKNRFIGKDKPEITFLEVFTQHNAVYNVSEEFAFRTLQKWQEWERIAQRFFLFQLNKPDIWLKDVNRELGEKFKAFLLTVGREGKPYDSDYACKLLGGFRKVLRYAVQHGYIPNNPWDGIKIKKAKEKPIYYLDENQLRILENCQFKNEALQKVADMFVFCAYTGVAYNDYKGLQDLDIQEFEGVKFISKGRGKSGSIFTIPLFPKAAKILSKYGGSVENLPKLSNQKANEHLKTISDIFEFPIGNNLTTHVARKTFCYMGLNIWKLPPATVAVMAGHKVDILLSRYARIHKKRIIEDLREVLRKAETNL